MILSIVDVGGAQEISEFMAINGSTIVDGDGNTSDWIEVHNPLTEVVPLAGLYLTDEASDLTKWQFPESSPALEPGEYRLVFASGQNTADYVDPAGFLHTSFQLLGEGEYLALVMADGVTVVSDFAPEYPPQSSDVSYGRADGTLRFFEFPTPGLPNGASVAGAVAFSRRGGLITEAFLLELSSDDPEAQIRYTLDGSLPEATSDLYSDRLRIEATAQVRARAFVAGEPGPVISHSYLLLEAGLQDFSSNLPLVVIDSFGYDINRESGPQGRDRPRRPVYSVFIDAAEGEPVNITGEPDVTGRGGMKVRGFTSQLAPKKSYSLEMWDEEDEDKDRSVLGFPSESDWVLYAPYGDKTLMRNHLAYKWWNEMGRYAVRTRFVEMFYNWNDHVVAMDDYVGVYVLMEKIKRDKNRVDITKLTPADNEEPEITGGYIVKVDFPDADESPFPAAGEQFILVDPKYELATDAQKQWIKGYLDEFANALYGPDFQDPELGYAPYIDVGSFVDYFLITEALKNGDGYYGSIFMHKEREEKLSWGPLWDFNVCLGNDLDWDCWDPRFWLYKLSGSFWFPRLFQDPGFLERRRERWFELRKNLLKTDRLLADIDRTAAFLDEAQKRNFERWDILGKWVQPEQVNPRGYEERDTYEKEVNWMRDWLIQRLDWLDNQFFDAPTFSIPSGRVSPGTELTLLNPNGEGEILYTINGPDPKRRTGGVSVSARLFEEPIVLTENSVIRARARKDERVWSGLAEATYVVNAPSVVLTEIMYNPTGGNDFEFVEFYNFGDAAVDLSRISLSQAVTFDFSEGSVETLQPGEYVVVVRNLETFTSAYGTDGIQVAGVYDGTLSNRRETVTLSTAAPGPFGDTLAILSIEYDDDWYPETDGDGHSLVLVDANSPPQTWDEPSSWRASELVGGSPGRAEPSDLSQGGQVPGDADQDGKLNLADAIFLLRYLFHGTSERLPCGDGSPAANLSLLDTNADASLDAADAISTLGYLFLAGTPPAQGRDCLTIAGCPDVCAE